MPATARKIILIAAFATLASLLPLWGQSLIGASDGLYRLDQAGRPALLLGGTDVRKIIKTGNGWYLLSSRGILFSQDLSVFEERNKGIPIKVIKTYDKGVKGFANEIQEVKDLEVDPYNDNNLVACTKDHVFLSQDGGKTWQRIPSPATQPGLKAVAVTSSPELLVFASHPIRGPFVRRGINGSWKEIGGELGRSDPGNNNPEEISDIVVRAGTAGPEVWAANSFLPWMYRYDLATSSFRLAYREDAAFGIFESLLPRGDEVLYVTDGAIMRLDPGRSTVQFAGTETMAVRAAAALVSGRINAYWSSSVAGRPLSLTELWLVSFKNLKPFKAFADGRFGLYLQTHFMVNPESRAKYNGVMDTHNMDMVVIDLKDDYGRLRFEPRDPLVKSIGRTVNPLDVEAFVAEMKAKGRYLVARIVVFKDKRLYEHAGGAYAVWDGVENKPWQGYVNETVEKTVMPPDGIAEGDNAPITLTVTERKYYEEHWVDPYSEKVWEYNVAIAREIIERGFDEVQFDYIRFPTDGVNMSNLRYRWRDSGMDMESALMSFLQYARKNVSAPISIDIYGANGWYRSGVRTGQDVELLARYVDVICPMFYPSHFEQTFMAFEPAVLRPYRIYHLGTLRNSYMARKQVVVRPYLQAFYMNVRYDREWYSPQYVSLQVDGVRDSTNEGLTFWNNAGRYDDIPTLLRSPDRRLAGTPGAQLLD
jgi:hypothetical protein